MDGMCWLCGVVRVVVWMNSVDSILMCWQYLMMMLKKKKSFVIENDLKKKRKMKMKKWRKKKRMKDEMMVKYTVCFYSSVESVCSVVLAMPEVILWMNCV